MCQACEACDKTRARHWIRSDWIPSDSIPIQGDNFIQSKFFSCYLAAIIHDYEHRGVNNDFLIKTSDPLALLYNDASPMENHHVAAAFALMVQDQYAFMPKTSKKVG